MTPLLKWAGGKRQLLPALIERMPEAYNRYYEPFFGGGALFFELSPCKSIINDYNSKLINFYIVVRDHLNEVIDYLKLYQSEYNALITQKEKNEYYYNKRKEYNDDLAFNELSVKNASLFLFLNKACYNGLYRVNGEGLFNTPSGKRARLKLYNEENIFECSKALAGAKILNVDFEEACKGASKGDFVYFDSPYYDTFDTYQAGGFSESDHKRLYNLFKRLSDRGVYCLLSNSDTDFIKELYKEYHTEVVPVKRMICCNGTLREGTEVIIRNY